MRPQSNLVFCSFLALVSVSSAANAQRRRPRQPVPPTTATAPVAATPVAPTQEPIAPTPVSEAERLVEAGIAAREQGHDEEALTLFRQSWELDHGARARAQMGFAEQALGHWVEAEQYVEEGLATTDPWIERNRAALERALATIRQNVGTLELRGGRPGAQIFINERPSGTMPLTRPLHLRTGQTQLRVQATGYSNFTRTVEIRAGVLSREDVELLVVAGLGNTGNTGNTSTPGGTARTGMSPAIGGAILGVGVAVVGVGVAMSFLREQQISLFNDDTRCLLQTPVNGVLPTRMDTCGANFNNANVYGGVAIAGYAVGGAAIVTGAVLLGISMSGRSAERATPAAQPAGQPPSRTPVQASAVRVQCAPWLNMAGIHCGGTF